MILPWDTRLKMKPARTGFEVDCQTRNRPYLLEAKQTSEYFKRKTNFTGHWSHLNSFPPPTFFSEPGEITIILFELWAAVIGVEELHKYCMCCCRNTVPSLSLLILSFVYPRRQCMSNIKKIGHLILRGKNEVIMTIIARKKGLTGFFSCLLLVRLMPIILLPCAVVLDICLFFIIKALNQASCTEWTWKEFTHKPVTAPYGNAWFVQLELLN